jgi:hypothetical protein
MLAVFVKTTAASRQRNMEKGTQRSSGPDCVGARKSFTRKNLLYSFTYLVVYISATRHRTKNFLLISYLFIFFTVFGFAFSLRCSPSLWCACFCIQNNIFSLLCVYMYG